MNSLSRLGIFGKEFSDMMEGRDDKNICVAMWIRWDCDVAYCLALGYVTAEGFGVARLVERKIALG
jgi:hypothetical protein